MRLGTSQKAVFDHLKEYCPLSAQQIGDALYTKTSSCAQYGNGTGSMGGRTPPEEIRRMWASKLLNELKKKGFVDFVKADNEKFWRITKLGRKEIR